jgi:anti-sigma factor RsiW
MTEHIPDAGHDALGRRLATELPRHRAPAHVRAAVLRSATGPAPRMGWHAPILASVATAMLVTLLFVGLLPKSAPTDPLDLLIRAVVAEHSRTVMWGARTVLNAVEESGIGLARRFDGDDRLTFVNAEPVYIMRRRGVALHYRDLDGHLITYVVLPGQGFPVPDRKRVQVDRFRPALPQDDGFATLLWRQGELVCLLVSDMVSPTDVENFKHYFVRVRTTTEPFPAY